MTSKELANASADVAIPQLMDSFGDRIYSLGLRLCDGPDEADDLVQETFVRAFRSWHQFEGRSRASTWLHTIAVRACQRMQRRRAGEPARFVQLTDVDDGGAMKTASRSVNPMDQMLDAELRDELDGAIAQLPPDFRIALVLTDIGDLKIAEVASILGIKEATVKTRVHRARMALRRTLGEALETRTPAAEPQPSKVCLDLLEAKMAAMDRGVPFPVPEGHLCSRCRSTFSTLDRTGDICRTLSEDRLPEATRRSILDALGKAARNGRA